MRPQFTDLPPVTGHDRRRILTDEVLDELRSRPHDWAIVHYSRNTSVLTGWRKKYGPQGFEFGIRRTGEGDRRFSCYARFVPEKEQKTR